jgi:hypothetical protein
MGQATANDPVNGWRWVFRTNLIVCGLLAIGFFLLYHVRLFPVASTPVTNVS